MLFKTELLWSYTPDNFFEAGTPTVQLREFAWTFERGMACCCLVTPIDPVPQFLIDQTRSELRTLLNIRSTQLGRVAELSVNPNIHQHTEAGVSHTSLPQTGTFSLTLPSHIDVVVTDESGRVIADTARDRRVIEGAELAARATKSATNKTLAHLYELYGKALVNPSTELVHLFSIVEAVEAASHKSNATQPVGISTARKFLGKLANDAPIHEGRHNGHHEVQLRHATTEERERAREYALKIIDAFANTL